MSSAIIKFPKTTAKSKPTDEQLIDKWYSSLSDDDKEKHYTLYQLKAATSVPLSRLPSALWALGWRTTPKPFPGAPMLWVGTAGLEHYD